VFHFQFFASRLFLVIMDGPGGGQARQKQQQQHAAPNKNNASTAGAVSGGRMSSIHHHHQHQQQQWLQQEQQHQEQQQRERQQQQQQQAMVEPVLQVEVQVGASSAAAASDNNNNQYRNNRNSRSFQPEPEEHLEQNQEQQDRQQRRRLRIDVENENLRRQLEAALAENATLRAEKATLRAENASLDEEVSVMALLRAHGGIPRMETNTSATPSLRGHAPATILEMSEKSVLNAFIHKIKVNFKKTNSDQLIKSGVAGQLGPNWNHRQTLLSNFNEASPAFHMTLLLRDVLHCMGLSSSASVGQEMSLFAMRPDIVIVRSKCRAILLVEVKNPGEDGRKALEHNVAAGQAFDYGMGLKQMGNDNGIVLMTTYDHMRISCLNDCSTSTTTAGSIMSVAAQRRIETDTPSSSLVADSKPIPSPEKKGPLTVIPRDSGARDNRGNADRLHPPDSESWWGKSKFWAKSPKTRRELYCSEIFGREVMFEALYFAITCGIVAWEQAEGSAVPDLVPDEGAMLDRLVACVGKTSFAWETIKGTASYKLKTSWRKNMKVYLYSVLGHGCSGKVYLGSSSAGEMFAVKLYLFDPKVMTTHFRAVDNKKAQDEYRKKLEKTRSVEVAKWKALYPCYRKSVFEIDLNKTPGLIMPYVASIPMTKRLAMIPEIQKELERLGKLGWAYKETDLRWRHIGLRTDGKGKENVILVDMESTESIAPKTVEEAVDESVKGLKLHAVGEPVSAPMEFFHSG
jgi:hypothetical protein